MPEQVLPQSFQAALEIGQANEKIVSHEFIYQGIQVQPTDPHSKQPFDFFLPDGRSCEVKLDIRSQATNKGYLETATVLRRPDIYIHTLCYALVFTGEQLNWLYNHGKIAYGGDYQRQDRFIGKQDMNSIGKPLWKFIRNLKQGSDQR